MFEIDLHRHVPVLRPQPPGVGKINFFNIPSTFQNMLCCCVKLILLEGLFLSMKCWSHNFALNNYQPLTDFSTVDLNCAGSNNGLGEISTTIF